MQAASHPGAAGVPDFVLRPATGPYRSLNPTTKLVIALSEAVLAFALGGRIGAALVLLVVLATAAYAGVLRRLGRVVLVTLPIIVSILLINTLLFPGATDVVARIGPLAPSWSGVLFGVDVTLRLLAMSLALALVYLTTETDDLLSDLERRGLGRRASFVVGAALETVPRTVERAAEIVDSQRARGLDTEGRPWNRARGVLPLAGPVVVGALSEVEERTIALESKAFTAPGRRTLLRVPPDGSGQRGLRWGVAASAVAVTAMRLGGVLPSL